MKPDRKQLAIFFSADEERFSFLEPMLPIFIEQINQSISQLLKIQKENDTVAFTALIHKIKGTSLTYGAKPIFNEIILIEEKVSISLKPDSISLSNLVNVVIELNKIHPI
jgi:hypothetical protein